MPLARAVIRGHSQVGVAIDAFLEVESFEKLPDKPFSQYEASGQSVS